MQASRRVLPDESEPDVRSAGGPTDLSPTPRACTRTLRLAAVPTPMQSQTATFSEKIRFAIRKMGMQVSAEKVLLSVSSTNADALE